MGVWVPGLAALHQSSVINHCESMWIWLQYMPSFRDENVQCLPKGKLLQLLELSANVLNMPLHTTFHVRTKNTQFTMQTNLRKCWLYMSCKNPAMQDVQQSLCPREVWPALQSSIHDSKPPEIHLAILKPVKAVLWNLNVIDSVLISKFYMETCNVILFKNKNQHSRRHWLYFLHFI